MLSNGLILHVMIVIIYTIQIISQIKVLKYGSEAMSDFQIN